MATNVLLIMSETDRGWAPVGHPFPQNVPLLCKLLLDSGFHVELGTNLERVKNVAGRDGLHSFDVVMFVGRFRGRHPDAEQALVDFVNGGKGLVVIHIASSSFPGSEEWKKLIGRVWLYTEDFPPGSITPSDHPPYGTFKVSVADATHPAMEGVTNFEVEDELYHSLGRAPEAQEHVLASAFDANRQVTEPMAFTLAHGGGRVFHTTLGHGPPTFNNPMFQRMLIQGTEWAAGRRG